MNAHYLYHYHYQYHYRYHYLTESPLPRARASFLLQT